MLSAPKNFMRLVTHAAGPVAVVAAAALVLPCTPLQAQTATVGGNWVQQSPATAPNNSIAGAMAYDGTNGRTVLFGGYDLHGNITGNTWTWDGSNWTAAATTGPAGRTLPTMAYNAAAGNVVLFGGNTGVILSDTWTWNGSAWTQQSPATHPQARYAGAMAYDGATRNVVLFGGRNSGGSVLADTWVWDGTTWTQKSPSTSPSARQQASMAYDAATGKMVLFGGLFGSALSDTWVWDGTTWTQQSPATHPPARSNATMAYDAATGTVLLFGGFDNNTNTLGDMWAWNGTTWTQLAPSVSPTARSYSVAAYDAARQTFVEYGGLDNFGTYLTDTWTYRGGSFLAPTAAVGTAAAQTTVYFSITGSGTLPTLSNSNVVTQGVSGQDFTLGTASSCTGAVTAGTTCTVNVAFTPKSPGLRAGAINLVDGSNNLLATAFISGTGTGPLATISPGVLTTVAGGTFCADTGPNCGDGGPATAAGFYYVYATIVDAAGNIYISDWLNALVRKVSAKTGIITTVVGGGDPSSCNLTTDPCGDGGQATAAVMSQPLGLALDGAGNLYIADGSLERVRKVTAATGIITTVAGSGYQCQHATDTCGDGGSATDINAQFMAPEGVAVDTAGNLYISDQYMNRVREVTVTGALLPFAGTGNTCSGSACGDGGSALSATLNQPSGVATDSAGNVYIADLGDFAVRKVSPGGIISTVAGELGVACSDPTTPCGDGDAATSAQMTAPSGVAVDAAGNLYITVEYDERVRKVSASTGFISTVAGNGQSCSLSPATCGNGLSATNSAVGFEFPVSATVDGAGNLYVADSFDDRVVKISNAEGISFPTPTPAGTADSTDGAAGVETVTLNNIGNATLSITSMQNNKASYIVSNPLSGGCSTSVGLAGGDSCLLGEQFSPVAGAPGLVIGSLAVSDNSLNASAVQTVPLTGTTSAGALSVQAGSIGAAAGTSSVTLAASIGYGGALPTGMVSFTVGGSSTGVGTITCKSKAAHFNCTAPYDSSLLTAGTYTITVAVTSDSNYSAASANSVLIISGSSSGAHVSPVTLLAPAHSILTPTVRSSPAAPAIVQGVPVFAAPAAVTSDSTPDAPETCKQSAKDSNANCPATENTAQPQ